MKRIHFVLKPEEKYTFCQKCGMLLIFKKNDRLFLTDESVWNKSEFNCERV
jgi:RNase P subunit RPR2